MSILSEIEKIRDRHFILFFFDVLFIVLPGVAGIFLFKSDLFVSMDWIKLILLSASMTAPVAFFNTLLFAAAENIDLKEKDGFFYALSSSLIITGIGLYLLFILGHLNNSGLKPLLGAIIFLEIIATIAAMHKERKHKKINTK